jgi:hypothetical protein
MRVIMNRPDSMWPGIGRSRVRGVQPATSNTERLTNGGLSPQSRSPMEYENAQKRILEVFRQWKAPANFKIEVFVVRVGEWGGHMLVDCDDPLTVHKFCSMLPAFVFEARPVVAVEDAVRVELEVIDWRDRLNAK